MELCDRRRGIGADGVVFLERGKAEFFCMKIFNSDGSAPAMCGNALRCTAKLLGQLTNKKTFHIETGSGVKKCSIVGENIAVLMGEPPILDRAISIDGREMVWINSGVPHLIVPVLNLEEVDVEKEGRALRLHSRFAPHGTNVNFVRADGDSVCALRSYERGVEAETLSCGTGATAAAYFMSNFLKSPFPINVKTKSGDVLQFNLICDKEIEMVGPAKFLFEGRVRV